MKNLLIKTLKSSLLAGALLLPLSAADLSSLASQESALSHQVSNAYRHGGDPVPYYNKLIRVHKSLRAANLNKEQRNMVTFLSFCLQDLRQALVAPRTRANAEIVADLDQSIQEGSRYLHLLGRQRTLASR